MANGPRAMDIFECLERLAPGGVGRVSVTDRALPQILPVRFACDGSSVLFGAPPGGLLARACDEAVVAFEIDEMSAVDGSGWSVLVVGVASWLPAAQRHLATSLGPAGWQGLDTSLLIRLSLGRVTGRTAGAEGTKVPTSGGPGSGIWPT